MKYSEKMIEIKIADKWKIFALNQILNDYSGSGVELFDKLEAADYGESDAIFEDHAAIEWQPFEYNSPDDLGDLIIDLARRAQITENESD